LPPLFQREPEPRDDMRAHSIARNRARGLAQGARS
jgi:hypothetical protein